MNAGLDNLARIYWELHVSRRFLLACRNKEALLDPQGGPKSTGGRRDHTPLTQDRWKYHSSMQKKRLIKPLSFIIIHIIQPPWVSTDGFMFSKCSHYTVSLYIRLLRCRKSWVEWTLWCTRTKCRPACSPLCSMCLLFHEASTPELWSCQLPERAVSLYVLVCVSVCVRERERDASEEDKALITLECH